MGKTLGIYYLGSSLLFGISGTLCSMILRLELYSSFGYLFYLNIFYLNRYALTRNFSRNKTLKRDIESAYKVKSLVLIRNHLKSYPCPKNINFLWNHGFLIILAMLLQILTGILLGLHYSSEMNYAYYSLMHIVREVYFGWCFRYTHSSARL